MEGWSLALALAVGVYDVFVKRLKERNNHRPPLNVRTTFDIDGDGDVDSFEFLRFLEATPVYEYDNTFPGYNVYRCRLDRPATTAFDAGVALIFQEGSQNFDVLSGTGVATRERTLGEIQ